jgi:hypothetical protein
MLMRREIGRLRKGKRLVAKTAAYRVSQARQASQANLVNRVIQARQVHLDSQVVHHWKFANLLRNHRVNHARKESQENQDRMENQAAQARTVHQAIPAKMAALDHQAHQAPTARQVHQAKMEKQDHQARQPHQFQPRQETKARQAKTAHQVQQVKMELRVLMEAPAHKDLKVHQDLKDHQAMMALQVIKDHQVQMDPKESLVFARNTAQPMVASSSKMEQDDKFKNYHRFHSIIDFEPHFSTKFNLWMTIDIFFLVPVFKTLSFQLKIK